MNNYYVQEKIDEILLHIKNGMSISEAFVKTNTVNSAWWKNEEVTSMFSGSSCRSTSVGDVVMVDEKKFECEPVGWKEI